MLMHSIIKHVNWILFFTLIFSKNIFSADFDSQIAMAKLENKKNEKLILSLTINEQLINAGAILIKDFNGSLLISKNDLKKSRVNLQDVNLIKIENDEYSDLSNFKNIKIDFDVNNQSIKIFLDESHFLKTELTNKNEFKIDALKNNSGIFLNYDIYSEFYNARNSLSGLFEIGGGLKQGLLTSNLAYLQRE